MNSTRLRSLAEGIGVSRRESEQIDALAGRMSRCDGVAADCAACRQKACVDAVGDALGGMIGVVLAHAAREDHWLRCVGTPVAERHVEAHAALAEELCVLTGLFVQSPALAEARLEHLARRFLEHDAEATENASPVVALSS